MSALNVAVIANCQSVGLGHAVRLLSDGANVRVVRIHMTTPQKRLQIRENLEKFDLILTQDARRFDVLNASELRAAFPDKCVVIPNVYFRGFHPDACYIGPLGERVSSPIGDYHSVVVLRSYLEGLSVAGCLDRFSPEGFREMGLDQALEESLDMMRARDTRLDVPGVPLLEACLARQSVFMYTINHPRIELLSAIAQAGLTQAGVACRPYDTGCSEDTLMFGPLLAIQPFLSDIFGYDVALPRWRAADESSTYLTNRRFIEACYRIYETADPGRLVVQSPPSLISFAQSAHA